MKDFDTLALALARRQRGLVTRQQLFELGASRRTLGRRILAGLWIPVGCGVLRLSGTPDDLASRSRAVALAHPGAVLTGPSACVILGPGPWDTVDLGSQPWFIAGRRSGFNARWLTHPGARARTINHLLVADRATTVIDLLRFLPMRSARTVAYRALQTGVITSPGLIAAANRLVRCSGAPQLRQIASDTSTGAHAHSEQLLIEILTRSGITGWHANHPVELPTRKAVADVAFPTRRLIVEVDGRAWHSSPERFQSDRARQNDLVRAGWSVLRFTWEDLRDRPELVVAQIRAMLDRLPAPVISARTEPPAAHHPTRSRSGSRSRGGQRLPP